MTSDVNSGAKIVVIGGGTGSFTLLSGLKNYTDHITAIVNMADDGGSTGVLRDELGALPPGDVRQCLVALSESPKVRDLFNYRFSEGTFEGHAFGNIFLTALEQMTGSFAEAVDVADEVLNVRGKVVPVTLDNVRLIIKQRHGEDIVGEHHIDTIEFAKGEERPNLEYSDKAELNPEAKKAIEEADMVVLAPGDIYGSLGPALIVDGMKQALTTTNAKIVYVCNLVTKPGQTDGFTVDDYADEIERFVGEQVIDIVLYNTEHPDESLLEKYKRDKEFGVEYNKDLLATKHYKAKGTSLISNTIPKQVAGDKVAESRAFIRHDPDVVARQLMKIYFS